MTIYWYFFVIQPVVDRLDKSLIQAQFLYTRALAIYRLSSNKTIYHTRNNSSRKTEQYISNKYSTMY